MKLDNTFVVPSDIDTAWRTLLNVEAVAPCMPGATLTGHDGDSFTAVMKVKLGPVLMNFAGEGAFKQKDEVSRTVVIEAKGKENSGAGAATALVTVQLIADGPTSTTANIVTDMAVTGKAAQFGRGVMVDVSKHMIKQFAGNLEKVIVASQPAAAATAAPAVVNAAVSEAPKIARPPSPVLRSEPLDLGRAALVPVLKRLVPAVAALAILAGALWWVIAH